MFAFFFQAEDGIRAPLWSRGLGDVYKGQALWRNESEVGVSWFRVLDSSRVVGGGSNPDARRDLVAERYWWVAIDHQVHDPTISCGVRDTNLRVWKNPGPDEE